MTAILDASAVLALVNAEPGWEQVSEALPDALISAVNLCEVVGKLTDHGVPGKEARLLLSGLGLEVVPFDTEEAYAAAALRAFKGGGSLSLGDRACLQLAAARNVPVLTADRYWARVDAGVELRVIR